MTEVIDDSYETWKTPPPTNTNPRRVYRSTSKSNINVAFNSSSNNSVIVNNASSSSSSSNNSSSIDTKQYRMEVGLENLGNTCFMNSTLQCLVHIPSLVTYFLNAENVEKDSNKDSPVNGIIADSFAKLVNEIYSKAEGSSVTPNQFKKALGSHAPHLLDYQQQDCQEFLRFLLDGLSEDLCRSKAKKKNTTQPSANSTPQKDTNINSNSNIIINSSEKTPQGSSNKNNSDGNTPDDQRLMRMNSAQKLRIVTTTERINNDNTTQNDNDGNSKPESEIDSSTLEKPTTTSGENKKTKTASEMANDAWKGYVDFNDSIVTDIFAGQLQSTIECLTCSNKSYCYDPFLDISIPIKVDQANQPKTILKNFRFGSSKCSLEECIEMFVQEEVLDGGNMYKCEKCNVLRKCKKKLSIFRFPEVLVVHMKRFRYNNNNAREKINTDVNFPLLGLDLTPFLSTDRDISTSSTNTNTNTAITVPIYDLLGVSNHTGGISGGHYIAHVNTNNNNNEASRWICFNDEKVALVNEASLIGSSAYVLFYKLRKKI